MKISYPTRCRIVDVTGEVRYGLPLVTPAVSRPHIGKEGLAKRVKAHGGELVVIKLDDGEVIYGHECWWVPLPEAPREETP